MRVYSWLLVPRNRRNPALSNKNVSKQRVHNIIHVWQINTKKKFKGKKKKMYKNVQDNF